MHHLIDHWGDVLTGIVSGGTMWSAASYAAQTFPEPANPYGKWLYGIAQFVLANKRNAQPSTPREAGNAQ